MHKLLHPKVRQRNEKWTFTRSLGRIFWEQQLAIWSWETQLQSPSTSKSKAPSPRLPGEAEGARLSVPPLLSPPCRGPGHTRLQRRRSEGPLEPSTLSSPGTPAWLMVTLTVPRTPAPAASVSGTEDTIIPPMIKNIKAEIIIPLQPFSCSKHPGVSLPP